MTARVLALAPIVRHQARAWIAAQHLHHPRLGAGWLCGVQVQRDGECVCVAILGRPSARLLQDGYTAEITRVATHREHPEEHAASKAIGALCRVAASLGYRRVISYTLEHEKGTCLRGAGFVRVSESRGGQWSRPSRMRPDAQQDGAKVRWERAVAA